MRLLHIPVLFSCVTSFIHSSSLPSSSKTITSQPFHTWLVSDASKNEPVLLVRIVTESCKAWKINLKQNFAMDWSTEDCDSGINSVSWSSIYDNMITDKRAIQKELLKMQKYGQSNYNDFETKIDLKINNLSGKSIKFEHIDAHGNILSEDQYFGGLSVMPEPNGGVDDDEDYDYNNTGGYTNRNDHDDKTQIQPPQKEHQPTTNLMKNRYPRTFHTYEKHLWLIKNTNTNQNIALFYSRKENTCTTWILTIKPNAELELDGDGCRDLKSGKHVQLIMGDQKVVRFLGNPKVKTFGQGDRMDFQVKNQMVDDVDVYWIDYDGKPSKF